MTNQMLHQALVAALGTPKLPSKVCACCGAAKPRKSEVCNSVGCISNVWVSP